MLPEQYMKQACESLGLPLPQIIETDRFRWVIDSPTPDFHKHMLKLEGYLQDLTSRPIDLRLERLEDKQKRMQRNVLGPKQPGR